MLNGIKVEFPSKLLRKGVSEIFFYFMFKISDDQCNVGADQLLLLSPLKCVSVHHVMEKVDRIEATYIMVVF